MAAPKTYSFARYLAAKKSVDDRALNRRVLETLTRELSEVPSRSPLRVLEVGAGIGTMVERLLDWRVLKKATYTAVDGDPQIIGEACRCLPRWATSSGFNLTTQSPQKMSLEKGDQNILVEFEAIQIADFAPRERGHRSWDLLIANAFLDLVDVPSTIPLLFSLLGPDGLFYFTMNHRVISGKPSGDSCTGRHLFAAMRPCGIELLDAGSSDWVVFAGANGYPEDEAYFLHHIIHTIHTALNGHPDLDTKLFASWTRERHNQVQKGTLVYIAHQLDFLGRVPRT
jgi:SAM-dependent methyltransferase